MLPASSASSMPPDLIDIPASHLQARLSEAYVAAVAAQAGCTANFEDHDYGLDVTIKSVQFLRNGKHSTTGHPLYCQLKSTITHIVQGDDIAYDMKAEAYNKIVTFDSPSPMYLVLYCLPRDKNNWLAVDETNSILRHCAYWMRLEGPILPLSAAKKRIKIPRQNLFNPTAVRSLLHGIKQGRFL